MRGTILGFDAAAGQGAISGEDGRRYRFAADEWRGGLAVPGPGGIVDFEHDAGGGATGVYPLPAAVPRATYPGQAQPGAAYASGQPYEKSQVAAGLLALFLGAWGVHKFYLGYNTEGAIMLGATIVSFVLTIVLIGIFGLMAIGGIALVEAIIYLTKTEEEFQQIYVQGRRPWF